jgi:hypothetical protein
MHTLTTIHLRGMATAGLQRFDYEAGLATASEPMLSNLLLCGANHALTTLTLHERGLPFLPPSSHS